GRDFEVYNDFNANLTNLYRCVRDSPEQLIDELTYTLNSRLDFDYVRKIMHTQASELPDVKRAAYFYQIIRQSYASGLDSFGAQPHRMWNNFPLIRQACARLQSVVIENRDFEKLIRQYDRPESFFYCDPPYYATEDYYEDVGFTPKDHERLADALCGIEGKFLLSYNDCPEIRKLYSREGIIIEGTTRLSNIAQRYEAGKQYAELLISNYNTAERYEMERQFTLFDMMHNEKILEERIPIWQ
ncbi:MAG: DNA adenine methylase, partial [Clostridia bacterium]|nr:DNA adenine methylase [Clostridia bacterium]